MEWLFPSLIAALTSTLMLAAVYGYLYTIYRRLSLADKVSK